MQDLENTEKLDFIKDVLKEYKRLLDRVQVINYNGMNISKEEKDLSEALIFINELIEEKSSAAKKDVSKYST